MRVLFAALAILILVPSASAGYLAQRVEATLETASACASGDCPLRADEIASAAEPESRPSANPAKTNRFVVDHAPGTEIATPVEAKVGAPQDGGVRLPADTDLLTFRPAPPPAGQSLSDTSFQQGTRFVAEPEPGRSSGSPAKLITTPTTGSKTAPQKAATLSYEGPRMPEIAASVTPMIGLILAVVLALAAAALPLFSRLNRTKLLELPTRRAIYDVIAARNGVLAADLSKATGLRESHVRYHLRCLTRAGLVVARDGVYTRPGVAANAEIRAARADAAIAVRDAVAASPGLPLHAIARNAGVSTALCYYHVKRLVAAGALGAEGEGRGRLYRLADRL